LFVIPFDMLTRFFIIALTFTGSLIYGCQQNTSYTPDKYLLPDEQRQFLDSIARYVAKLPKRATHEQKFDKKYDAYYQAELQKYQVKYYYISPDSTHFFLVTRPAPSLYDKKVAVGGRVKYKSGKLSEYEEVFRTWKMKDKELQRKGEILFAAMVEKGNVDEYLPHRTQEDWVEFPDSKNYFDVASRRWRMEGQSDTAFYIR
jgi:hypothetical protein